MATIFPADKPRVWKCETYKERVQSCAAMLTIHGFLSDAERAKVDARIRKWLAANKPAPAGDNG